MSRPLRINRSGGWYHVTARRNAGERIYWDDNDRRHFLELVAALPERYGVQVHGYVLMSNHYHLLLRTAKANLNRAMQWLKVCSWMEGYQCFPTSRLYAEYGLYKIPMTAGWAAKAHAL